MGRSPRKWFKTLLFGSKSSSLRKRKDNSVPTNDKEIIAAAKEPPPNMTTEAPFTLQSLHAATGCSESNSGLLNGLHSSSQDETHQNVENEGLIVSDQVCNLMLLKEEQSAILVQSTFRGFLARRAFRALNGVIRLQALVRGQLVRRQAIATMYALHGIVKLQAHVRGKRVRGSGLGLDVYHNCIQKNVLVNKIPNPFSLKERLSKNLFITKLLENSSTGLLLQIDYAENNPNSTFSWLNRWSLICFWKPVTEGRASVVEPQKRNISEGSVDALENVQAKFIAQNNTLTGESPHLASASKDNEKPRRFVRKAGISRVDQTGEQPKNEIEKVKNNLRKVSLCVEKSSEQLEEHSKANYFSTQTMTSLVEGSKQVPGPSGEEKEFSVMTSSSSCMETLELENFGGKNCLPDSQQIDELPLRKHQVEDGDTSVANVNSNDKDAETVKEVKQASRRISMPAKAEDSSLTNTASLPSYMAATESAKAKLRGQGSPKFGLDIVEKNGVMRRHSLPAPGNGKIGKVQTSPSPSQRLVGMKTGNRIERSSFSRDSHEKMVDWRR